MKNDESVKLLAVLSGRKAMLPPPVWMMRQAGRYLPEYRAVRAKAGSFWTMCMTPELAAEVTLQPIARYGLDAAIVFSDILVVPYALGSTITFEENVGPRLAPVTGLEALERSAAVWAEKLAPAYEALKLVRGRLESSRALLGFAGAPWTLATYMAEGGGSSDQKVAKLWGYRDPKGFRALLDAVGECVAQHLIAQLGAGADAVQIFDSWAQGLTAECFREWVVEPTRRIVEKVRAARPGAKIIGFPRGATLVGYETYAAETGVDALSLDTAVPIDWAAKRLGGKVALQGNLDPIALIAGGEALASAVDGILAATRDCPFVFNLGHGILPETPPRHVADVVARIRAVR